MNKKELISEVAQRAGVTKVLAKSVIECFFGVVRDSISTKSVVRMIGFGSFKTVDVAAKKVRNPRSGEEILVPANTKVKFVPGQELKKAANG